MSELDEGLYKGEFMVSEAEGTRSRDVVTVLSGQVLQPGHVVGQIKTAAEDHTGNTGNGAMSGLSVSAQARLGNYVVKAKSTGPGVAANGTGAAVAGGTGNGTITASPATGAGCKVGTYKITCIEPATNGGVFSVEDPNGINIGTAVVGTAFTTQVTFTIADGSTDFAAGDQFTIVVAAANSGTFSVEAPNGEYLPDATVGTAYASDQINFTIADGSTDFIVGDKFTITVSAGKVKEYNPANTDGSGKAMGVMYDAADATSGDVTQVAILRDAEVNAAELTWFSGATGGQKTAGLADLATAGIIGR